jgi:hypothetical protein
MIMLTSEDALNVFVASSIIAGGWVNKTLGNYPAHLFLPWDKLKALGIQQRELEGEYMRKPITHYTTPEGCALNIEVISYMISDNLGRMAA